MGCRYGITNTVLHEKWIDALKLDGGVLERMGKLFLDSLLKYNHSLVTVYVMVSNFTVLSMPLGRAWTDLHVVSIVWANIRI